MATETTGNGQEIARLTADAVVFGTRNRDRHVLLIRRGWEPFKGYWALPGGHVDAGEHTAAAAHRELREETGLTVPALQPFAVYADPGRDPRGRYVTFAYTTRLADTPLLRPADDAVDARWLLADDVLTGVHPLGFDHRRLIDDALRVIVG